MKVDSDLSVNEIIKQYPRALPVLNSFGIDTCCGGEDPISVAAENANVALETIIAAIEEATDETP
jgi:regulator of cell morphogenesis and NO signaling